MIPGAAAMRKTIILVPIYKDRLDPLEQYSLDHSLAVLGGRHPLLFIGPEGLDLSAYQARYPGMQYLAFPAENFASIPGYNRLLLSPGFYTRFLSYEYLLILQTDAILLRDELDYWAAQPFDYVGAPWPDGVEILVNAGVFEGARGKRTRAHVGNGGLSLRRVRKCLSLLQEFGAAVDIFHRTGSSEDLFFSIMGGLSTDFILPNEVMASRFAMELKPSFYFAVNGGVPPMGGHAWWKYEPEFWRQLLPEMPEAVMQCLPERST